MFSLIMHLGVIISCLCLTHAFIDADVNAHTNIRQGHLIPIVRMLSLAGVSCCMIAGGSSVLALIEIGVNR